MYVLSVSSGFHALPFPFVADNWKNKSHYWRVTGYRHSLSVPLSEFRLFMIKCFLFRRSIIICVVYNAVRGRRQQILKILFLILCSRLWLILAAHHCWKKVCKVQDVIANSWLFKTYVVQSFTIPAVWFTVDTERARQNRTTDSSRPVSWIFNPEYLFLLDWA